MFKIRNKEFGSPTTNNPLNNSATAGTAAGQQPSPSGSVEERTFSFGSGLTRHEALQQRSMTARRPQRSSVSTESTPVSLSFDTGSESGVLSKKNS